MNILTDALPESVYIDGREFPVNVDFCASLKTIMAFEDASLTNQERAQIALINLYLEVPTRPEAALERVFWFLNGGESTPSAQDDDEQSPRLYSFIKDANFIFAAFRQTHGIDLTKADLHWWEFLALFMDLGQDTTFCQLVSLRKRVKSGVASKEERKAALEMGAAFEIPELDHRTLEEKEVELEFMRRLEKGKR